VKLSQSEELKDLLWLWGKLSDTSNSDNNGNLWLSFNVESTIGFSISLGFDECGISGLIFIEVLFSIGLSYSSSSFSISLSFLSSVFKCF